MTGRLMYIDPGTGSMLFSILIGLVATGFFFLKKLVIRIKFMMSGGRARAEDTEKLPYVIFSDSKRYWNVFKPICDEFEKRGIPAEYWTASEDDPALTVPYEHVKTKFIGKDNRAFARLNVMSADVCLSTTPGLDVYQWKRSRSCSYYVHTFHSVDAGTGYRMFGLDFYDSVLLTGTFQGDYIRKLEEMRHLPPKELTVVGSTYMDTVREQRDNTPETEHSGRTVLVAPSWGASGILSRYGSTFLKALKQTGYHIIVRPHPQSFTSEKEMLDSLMKEFPEEEHFEWNRDNDNFAVMERADIMITDFSGIIFDYALGFDRPLIYADTHYDTGPYDAAWFDEELWTLQQLPKLGVKLKEEDFGRMKEVIDGAIVSDTYAEGREEVRRTVWQHAGKAASETVDYLVAKREAIAS